MKVTESSTVTVSGLYRMSAAEYHAGPCNSPELSASIAKILTRETPLHAWTKHSKLGRAPADGEEASESEREKSTNQQDFGTVAHKLALGFGREVAVIDPNDHVGPRGGIPKGWTNDSIKTARAEALDAGKVPILPKYHGRAEKCAKALREGAEAWLGMPVEDCIREYVICWQEANGIWCKAMADISRPDLRRTLDFKTTGISSNPESVARHMYSEDMEVQAAFYLRGQDALDPANVGRRKFGFLFVEQRPPHAASPVIVPSEAGMQLGRWAVENAISQWSDCLGRDEWPGYPAEEYEAMPPAWKMQAMGNEFA